MTTKKRMSKYQRIELGKKIAKDIYSKYRPAMTKLAYD